MHPFTNSAGGYVENNWASPFVVRNHGFHACTHLYEERFSQDEENEVGRISIFVINTLRIFSKRWKTTKEINFKKQIAMIPTIQVA
ncbi:hypothetical protein SUGI_0761510 [Cryptomeria japonica]|nr:hypothetical protein SUGI_0761510 [Cryptomeria japonica]